MTTPARVPLRTVAAVFLWLGATSFGGPAAHIALMEADLVRRRKWLTAEEYLGLVAAANLIPGPNSTEVAIHVGHRVAGWAGLVVAGACFILPAALTVWAVATTYVAYGTLPAVAGVLAGVKPVVLAVVAQAVWNLGKTCLTSPAAVALAVFAFTAALVGVHELLILLAAALATLSVRSPPSTPAAALLAVVPASAVLPPTSASLFVVFLRIGSVLFGSGYVLLAFLRSELVERLGWITERQLLDAVAVGQVTPGPVFTTATFVGYVVAGHPGAVAATAGIFLPAFAFVALSVPVLPRLKASPAVAAALKGVTVASWALMAAVLVTLAGGAVVDVPSAGFAVLAAVLLVRFKADATYLVAAGAVLGWARS